MAKEVTQLIQDIGKCRDILDTRDFKTVLKNIYLFQKVYEKAKIEVDRFTKNAEYELDFTYYDLKELSDEIFAFIKNYQSKFTFDNSFKKLTKYKTIDNDSLKQYIQEQCDLMYVDARLREAYKILSYLSIIVWVFQESYKNLDFDVQVTSAIRSFLVR